MSKIKRLKECTFDYNHIINLLGQLTYTPAISDTDFKRIITSLPDNIEIFVYTVDEIPIGMATILVEQKIIHGGKCVGHIEDVVVDKQHRGKGIAKTLLQHCITHGKNSNCYKIILDCGPDMISYYETCGFSSKNIGMAHYFT